LDVKHTDKILHNFPSTIQRVIINLRSTIDQLDSDYKSAKESITELARRIDEDRICERSKVSRLIKYILKDKILEGKITAKWIEDCLPEDYKRRYSKSEVSSLSRKVKKPQGILVDNRGEVHAGLVSPNDSGKENHSIMQKEQAKNVAEGCPRCPELEEALRKASKIPTAEQLADSKIKVAISKDKYKEIKSAMRESSNLFYIIVDSINRVFVRAEVDLKDVIAD
jgi:hypothetical protein